MRQIGSKSQLAVALSRLKGFAEPDVRHEQYATDSEVAGHMLWNAYMLGDIEGKVIADLGCGTGILGIGATLLGAGKVYFVDMDKKALETAKMSFSKVRSESSVEKMGKFICQDITEVNLKAEVVIQNPPFGTKIKHNDAVFLEKALEIAPIVYSLHKSESKAFLEGFSAKKNAKITHIWDFKLPLKATMKFHRRQIHRIDVSCFRFEKNR
ncbi:MAG: METTL5 family protein [Nanoarchaeota archaeon]